MRLATQKRLREALNACSTRSVRRVAMSADIVARTFVLRTAPANPRSCMLLSATTSRRTQLRAHPSHDAVALGCSLMVPGNHSDRALHRVRCVVNPSAVDTSGCRIGPSRTGHQPGRLEPEQHEHPTAACSARSWRPALPAAGQRFEYERRASRPASPISVRAARPNRQERPLRPDELVLPRFRYTGRRGDI